MYTFLKLLDVFVMVASTIWFINYKYSATIKLFKYNEDELPRYGRFSVWAMNIMIVSWTLYIAFF